MIFLLLTMVATIVGTNVYANKKECGTMKWGDKSHGYNKPSSKKFNQELNNTDICNISKNIDHMKSKGAVKDWTEFKTTSVYKTADAEQKKCLKEAFDSPDSNHKKNLADYELSYCGTDKD